LKTTETGGTFLILPVLPALIRGYGGDASDDYAPTGKRMIARCSGVNDCHKDMGIELTSRLSSAYQRRT
jgi:hypothetical protein